MTVDVTNRERYVKPILRLSAGWRIVGTRESVGVRRGRSGAG